MTKIHLTFVVFLAALLVPQAAPAAHECMPTERCEPPPCELFEQIKMKQAVKRMFSRPKVRQQFIRQAGGDNARAAKLLNEYVEKKADAMGKKLRCPWKHPLPPPSFETNPSCEIIAYTTEDGEAMSRDSALSKLDTCSEFVEAIYDHEQVHKDICFKTNSVERANEGITVYAAEERQGYTREIESLRAKLKQLWNACTEVRSAELARKLAAAGVRVLYSRTPKSGAGSASTTPAQGG